MTKSMPPHHTAAVPPSVESLLENVRGQFTEDFAASFLGKNTDKKVRNAIPDFIAYDHEKTADALYEAFFSSGTHKNLAQLYQPNDAHRTHSPLYKYIENGLRAEAFEKLTAVLPEETRQEWKYAGTFSRGNRETRKHNADRFLEEMQEADESIDVHTYTHQILAQLDGWIKECVPDTATCRQMLNEMNRDFPVLTEDQEQMKDSILYEAARWTNISKKDPRKALELTVELGLKPAARRVAADVLTRHPAVNGHINEENAQQFAESAVLPVLQRAFSESARHLGMENNPCEGKAAPAMELPVSAAQWSAFEEDLNRTVAAIMPRSLEIKNKMDQVKRTHAKGGMRIIM